jgi:hypothetical protein
VSRLASVLVAVAVLGAGVIYLIHHDSTPRSCGVFLVATWSGRHVALDGCDGELISPPAGISVAVGQRVTLDYDHQWSGFFSSNPTVLAVEPRGTHVGVFQAIAGGNAVIQIKTARWCASRVSKAICHVLTVTVSG